jgi:DNA-directed RNA polymerase subunit H (RpoH/RPB5)
MSGQNSSILISNIYYSRKTILELADNQGYNINNYANFSINEVNAMELNNQLDMLLETKDEEVTNEKPKKKIYIHYFLGKMIKQSNLQEIIDDLFNLTETLKKEDTLYIILKNGEMNETIMNELKHIWETDGIFIVIESIKRLKFNILKHILVPQHIVMTDNQTQEIMKKYNILNKIDFPEISRFDPVARAICLRPGQLCHIIRPSKTAIETNYYRICV